MKKMLMKEKLIFIASIMLILAARLYNISDLNAPCVFGDEAAYWSHAANLAGLPWTDVEHSWFSYGYSFLLVPLFFVTHNMSWLYRMAIVLNALMGVASFIIGIAIRREIDKEFNYSMTMLLSLTSASYSSYLMQSNVAWAETFLYMWFLFGVWGVIRFVKHTTWKNTAMTAASCFFLYIIHNRCIVAVIAYIVTVLYMALRNKLEWTKVILTLMIFIMAFSLNGMMKTKLETMLIGNEGGVAENTIVLDNTVETNNDAPESDVTGFNGLNTLNSHIGKLKLVLSLEGWKKLIFSFGGKLWYLLTSTIMMAYFGVIYIVRKLVSGFKEEKSCINYSMHFFYVFLALFICGTLAVASLAIIPGDVDYTNITRLDFFFYGRYEDILSGILIICALLHLVKTADKKLYIYRSVGGLVIYLLCFFVLHFQIKDITSFYLNNFCVPGICFSDKFSHILYSGILITVYVTGCALLFLANVRKNRLQCLMSESVCILLLSAFLYIGQTAYQNSVLINQKSCDSISEICDILEDNKEYKTYYLGESKENRQAVRTRAIENEIKYFFPEKLDENCFVIIETNEIQKNDLSDKDLYYVMGRGDLLLFARGDEIVKKLRVKGCPLFAVNNTEFAALDMSRIKMSIGDTDLKIVKEGEDLLLEIDIMTDDSSAIIINDVGYCLSYHIYDAERNPVSFDNERYIIHSFSGFERIPVMIDGSKLRKEGKYIIEIDMLEEGVAWLSTMGGDLLELSVEVKDNH